MKSYQEQLDWFAYIPENKDKVKEYLKKYFLDKQELSESRIKVKNTIFNESFDAANSKLSEIFNPDYEFMYSEGGGIFLQQRFESLSSYMQAIGEKTFIILEDYDEDKILYKYF